MNASLFYLVNEFLFLRRGTLDSFIIPSPVQFFIALPSVGDDDDDLLASQRDHKRVKKDFRIWKIEALNSDSIFGSNFRSNPQNLNSF